MLFLYTNVKYTDFNGQTDETLLRKEWSVELQNHMPNSLRLTDIHSIRDFVCNLCDTQNTQIWISHLIVHLNAGHVAWTAELKCPGSDKKALLFVRSCIKDF